MMNHQSLRAKSIVSVLVLYLIFGLYLTAFAQGVATSTVTWSGGHCTFCNGKTYACSTGSGWNNGEKTFTAAIPAGAAVTKAKVTVYYHGCYGTSLEVAINGQPVGTLSTVNSCSCEDSECEINSVTASLSNYNASGTNTLKITAVGGQMCVAQADIEISYCSSPTSTPSATPSGTLASQGNTWSLDQPINLLTNVAVTGVPAGDVKWAMEYKANGNAAAFTRVVTNPSSYQFEAPGTIVMRPSYFCGQGSSDFPTPIEVKVNGGFKQKIDVDWPGTHVDIFVVCEVMVRRGSQTYYKGTTSEEGKLYVDGLKNGDLILVKSTRIMKPSCQGTFTVNFSDEQATPIVITLSPGFVDAGF